MKRRNTRTDVRAELLADERWLLELAERIGDAGTTERIKARIAHLEASGELHNLHGWEVGMPPTSGPWTLTADDELVRTA